MKNRFCSLAVALLAFTLLTVPALETIEPSRLAIADEKLAMIDHSHSLFRRDPSDRHVTSVFHNTRRHPGSYFDWMLQAANRSDVYQHTLIFAPQFQTNDDVERAGNTGHRWAADVLKSAREFSQTLDTAAVVILHQGEVVDQWGAVAMPLNCHSIRKSILSALFGSHVGNNTIDLDATLRHLGINDNEPSLTEAERSATLRDLLKARSGIYHPALYETAAMAAKRPQRGSHAPGTFWYYNNWDFNASCTIFENLTGRSIFEEFESRIAEPLGMQDFRRERDTRYVTGDDSVHPAYPFHLSTRDLAKFGQLMLQRGTWNGKQLVPESWVRESTTSYSDAGPAGGYGYMWWVTVDGNHFPGVSLPNGSYSARGYRGQYLVVVPKWDLVVCHRVNSFQEGTSVSKSDFGKLLAMIVTAKPESTTDLSKNSE